MPVRDILILPDPRLRQVAAPVGVVDEKTRNLADDMLATMYDAPGIGLAAPQVGVLSRVIVCDVAVDEDAEPDPMVLINPVIETASEALSVYEEGCLSIPDYLAPVTRPAEVRVAYLDREGRARHVDAGGLLATCLQHEIDHLSRLKRERVTKKFAKQAKAGH